MEAKAAKLEGILRSAVTAIITIDHYGLIESANPATQRLFGYQVDELIGQNVKLLMPEPYKAEHDGYLSNYLKTSTKKIIGIGREVSGRRKDGSIFPLHLAVSEFEAYGQRYFTGIIHDLSDRKQVEEALRESERKLAQAQKMEAVGQLTGGVAHDFNNLLLVITGNLEFLEQRLGRDDIKRLLGDEWNELRGFVTEAQEAAALGSRLTDQLLTFARRRHLDAQTLQLNDLVVGVTDLLRRTIGEHISLTTSLRPDLWETRTDQGQFQSALVNLAVNARDAMPNGGKLAVETDNVMLSADQANIYPGLVPGDYVRLSISDTGIGMPPEIRERVFEPFFTTKEVGRGTGLGLAMVYGFVKQSGGHVTIYSEVGHGTTINLYLPGIADGAREATASAEFDDAIRGGREVILVVEDDARVRRVTVTRLKMIGYEVLEAHDGPTALNVLDSRQQIDVLFTDLIMPGGLSGRDVAIRARELMPNIRVLLTSGYAEDLVRADELQRERLSVLRKPYRQAELVNALRGLIGRCWLNW
jgi:PAS domain S-box-containing protein